MLPRPRRRLQAALRRLDSSRLWKQILVAKMNRRGRARRQVMAERLQPRKQRGEQRPSEEAEAPDDFGEGAPDGKLVRYRGNEANSTAS